MPSDHPSQVFALMSPGRSTPTESVRYTVKTKVTMTALKAAEPQSHAAHAAIRPRVTGRPVG